MSLFRAIVSSRRLNAEMLVFFDLTGMSAERAGSTLEAALCLLWDETPDGLVIYNLHSEREALEEWALGPAATGDVRLFESGCAYGTVLYHEPANTLMLVRPRTLRRLQSAQAKLPIVEADDATRPMPLVD